MTKRDEIITLIEGYLPSEYFTEDLCLQIANELLDDLIKSGVVVLSLAQEGAAGTAADSDYLTVEMVGEQYPAIGWRMAKRLVSERMVPVYRIGARRVVVRRSELLAWIESGRIS